MKTIFDSCIPREEVLKGHLQEDIFQASLTDTYNNQAPPVYQDPKIFFNNTYVTEGLKTLAKETLGRLTGTNPSSSPIIRLETSFGGGKTHNLIALFHLATAKVSPDFVNEWLSPDLLPKNQIKTVCIVGTDLDASTGMEHPDVTTYTLWGELAYQIGGIDSYKSIEGNDLNKQRPGESTIKKLIGDKPTLILIDELAPYLRTAKGIKVEDTTLAKMTSSFFMSLLGAVGSSSNVVVVYSLAESKDAFSEETEEILKELQQVSARQERIITPTGEQEIAPIVTRRMFKSIDRNVARETSESFYHYYLDQSNQRVDLPARALTSDYCDEMTTDYPFHPELLTTLNRKTATIPNFHKTRGALRLLAMVIRRLWEVKPKDVYMIQPWSLDLAVDDIVNELTSRLERPQFRHAVEADIATPLEGSKSHAEVIDESWIQAGKPAYANRAAVTIFLNSLVMGTATGVELPNLLLASIQPNDQPELQKKAIDKLYETCWYLEYDGNRYKFKTEPSINKIIEDEKVLVGNTTAKGELDNKIHGVWKKGIFSVNYFPCESADVEDDSKEPKLIIIHYDAAATTQSQETPPDIVLKINEYSGISGSFRTFRNNLIFLVADKDQIDSMVDWMRRYLAINRLINDAQRYQEFSSIDRDKLKKERDEAELFVRISITRVYKYLYYPTQDAPKKNGFLAREILPAQDQGDINKNQSDVVLKRLRDLNKVLTADDQMLSAHYVKSKAWLGDQQSMTTESLRKVFAQKFSLKMLLDPNQLKKTVKNGIEQGTWVYYESESKKAYGKDSVSPYIKISEDVQLYIPEEAERLKLLEPPQEICSKCGKNKSDCICQEEICPVCKNLVTKCSCGECPTCHKSPCICGEIVAEGLPSQSLQSISDQCLDKGIDKLESLKIQTQGMGTDLARDVQAIGLAIPQMGKATFNIDCKFNMEFGGREIFTTTFKGSWDRYKRIKTITDTLAKESSQLSMSMSLSIDYDEGLDLKGERLEMIKNLLTSLNIGKIRVMASPKK